MLKMKRKDDCMVVMEWQPEEKRKVGRSRITWKQWKRSADRRVGPAGLKLGALHKTELVGERGLQLTDYRQLNII